jgi:choline dehydrogenase-like flavoprotein
MAAPFDLTDDSVVVVIGTGAGGGVLANELAQKGVKVVALEAGGRYLPEDYVNDEWEPSASSPGSTPAPPAATGGWRRTSPACRPGSSRRWAARRCTGPAPRSASRTTSGRRAPPTAPCRAPTCSTGRSTPPRWRRGTRRPRPSSASPAPATAPGLPGNNNYKVFEGRQGARLQGGAHRPDGDQLADYDDRLACQQTGFCFQGCKWGAKWSAAYTDIPRGEATGNLEVRDRAHVAADRARREGKVTGVVYADADGNEHFQKRAGSSASRATRSRARGSC